jgi:RNA polymerase sigma-70 factor (ECF subfamily)
LLVELLPDSEAIGLLALMLLHDSRRAARLGPEGGTLLISEQDRALWNGTEIAEGAALARRAMAGPVVGHYAIQSAIALEHTRETPDWAEIVSLYDMLVIADPSPVVRLNRAAALSMRDGPLAALPEIESLLEVELQSYHLAHSAHADVLRRLGKSVDARAAYGRALTLCANEADRKFLERRLAGLDD